MDTIKYITANAIELQKGDWVKLKPSLFVNGVYGSLVLFDFMVFPGIKQIEEVISTDSLTTYKINNYHYSKEMLEIVARDSYSNSILQSTMEAWEGFKSYNSATVSKNNYDSPILQSAMKVLKEFKEHAYNSAMSAIASKEKDDESSSLNLVINKNKKKIHLNFKQ